MFRTSLNRQARPHGKLLLTPHIMVSDFIGKKKGKSTYGYVSGSCGTECKKYQADCGNKRFCGSDVTEYSTNIAGVKSLFCN